MTTPTTTTKKWKRGLPRVKMLLGSAESPAQRGKLADEQALQTSLSSRGKIEIAMSPFSIQNSKFADSDGISMSCAAMDGAVSGDSLMGKCPL
jgi:hypothetical protein